MGRLEHPFAMLAPQVLQYSEGLLAFLDDGRKGTLISGTVACSSSGADLGLVMSAIANLDSLASSRTASVKSFISGLSKLNTIGR